MTLEEKLKLQIREEMWRYKHAPEAAAHAIARLMCRYTYALGFMKGVECGKAFPDDPKTGTLEEGYWFAGYAFADEEKTPTPEEVT